jgi:hypothetical protein
MREAQRTPGIAERPSDQQDQDLTRRLAAEAKKAAEAYVKTALALDSQWPPLLDQAFNSHVALQSFTPRLLTLNN